jgi:hypothetical protein
MEWLPEAKRERDLIVASAAGALAAGGAAPSSGVPVIGMFPAHGG